MKKVKEEWLQLCILAAPFCVAALLWDKLPERMPIHWNAHGQVDGYAGKGFAAFFVPCLNIAMTALIFVLGLVDPRIRKYEPETRAQLLRTVKLVRLAISGFLCVAGLTVLAIGAGLAFDMSRVMWVGMSFLLLVIGNLMGKLRPNYFIGVRTPWTLESTDVWTKTHRLAGKVMVIGSLVVLAGSFVLPPVVQAWFAVVTIVVIAFVPLIYSYVIYKRRQAA